MLTHRGFSAWIVVDGTPLPEYLVAVDGANHRVSCWIPSEEGKTFSVYWKDHGGKVETCGYITLDGYVAPGRFLYGDGVTWRGGVRTGPTSERPFIFQKVDENVADLNDDANDKEIGTIVLRIKRVKFSATAAPNAVQPLPQSNRGKNGMRVGFGTERPAFEQYPSTWKVESYDNPGQKRPSTYVSFVFRYRGPEFLKTQGIIEDTKPFVENTARPPARRVVSMPASTPPVITPSPSPPTFKKASLSPVYYRMGPQNLQRPDASFRRTASLNAPLETEEDTNPVNYPGEGLLVFPPQKSKTDE